MANAIIFAADAHRADGAARTLEAVGYRVVERAAIATASARLDAQAQVDLILIDATGAEEAALAPLLVRLDTLAHSRGTAVIAECTLDQLDLVAAMLTDPSAQILCEPAPYDLAGAAALSGVRTARRLHDQSRDDERAQLQRVTAEVSRIAETLARIANGPDSDDPGSVRSRTSSYRAMPVESAEPVTAAQVRDALRARRMRDKVFGGDLFADPAWDMLLDLYAAELEQRRVSVSSLCIASAVPPTTALRHIGAMIEAGFLERSADPGDRRRAYISLAEQGRENMRHCLGLLRRHGLPIP